MSQKCVPHSGALSALIIAFAACLAALVSHIGIDIAGDYLLPHDSYDGVGHQSRSDVFALAAIIAIATLLHFVAGTIREARLTCGDGRATFEKNFGRAPWRCVGVVVVLTLASLATMEAMDLAAGGSPIDDLADLFGGSMALGLSISVPVAALAAAAARILARFLLVSQRTLAVALQRLIALATRSARRTSGCMQRPGRVARRRYRSVSARRCAKRGPPLFAS